MRPTKEDRVEIACRRVMRITNEALPTSPHLSVNRAAIVYASARCVRVLRRKNEEGIDGGITYSNYFYNNMHIFFFSFFNFYLP